MGPNSPIQGGHLIKLTVNITGLGHDGQVSSLTVEAALQNLVKILPHTVHTHTFSTFEHIQSAIGYN